MTRRNLLLVAATALAGDKKKKQDKPPDLEIVDFAIRRTTEGTLELDGRVRNIGPKPIEKLVLVFRITSPDGKTVTTQKGTAPDPVLEPGQEFRFEWQTRDHVRAVSVEIGAVNRSGDELLVVKPGPYPIE